MFGGFVVSLKMQSRLVNSTVIRYNIAFGAVDIVWCHWPGLAWPGPAAAAPKSLMPVVVVCLASVKKIKWHHAAAVKAFMEFRTLSVCQPRQILLSRWILGAK